MSGSAWLRGPLALNLVAQLVLGGFGFALAPEQAIGVPLDDAARLGFRLAAFNNATTAAFTLYALLHLDAAALRALAACLAAYHALAGAQALHGLLEGGALAAVGASAGPFHVVSAMVLVAGIVLSRRVTPAAAGSPG